MNKGKLLIEDTPSNILTMNNTNSIETAFINLIQKLNCTMIDETSVISSNIHSNNNTNEVFTSCKNQVGAKLRIKSLIQKILIEKVRKPG